MVKTKYVPVDNPRVVCGSAKINDGFKSHPYLDTVELPDVKTDDDVELLAKTALDDIVKQDVAFTNLVNEVIKLEERCANEEKEAIADRQETLDSIDELNKSKP